MKEFLKLNGWKLKYAAGAGSIVGVLFVLILCIIAYATEGPPSLSFILLGMLFGGVGLPLFMIIIGTLRFSYDLSQRRKVFNTFPFSELISRGFLEQQLNAESKWRFNELILTGKVGNFELVAEAGIQEKPYTVRFCALFEPRPINEPDGKRIKERFDQENITIDREGIAKVIPVKKHKLNTVDDLTKELEQFVSVLNEEGIRPLENPFVKNTQ